jgi:hypothetical protein
MQTSFTVPNITQTTPEMQELYIGGYPAALSNFSGVISNVAVNGQEKKFDQIGDLSVLAVNVLQASQQACLSSPCQNNGICLE